MVKGQLGLDLVGAAVHWFTVIDVTRLQKLRERREVLLGELTQLSEQIGDLMRRCRHDWEPKGVADDLVYGEKFECRVCGAKETR